MVNTLFFESHRRTVIKSLLWRFIGIFWTWGGAYIIILMLPKEQKNAITIATLVTAWHHSTRMVMYYMYERVWARINWGKSSDNSKLGTLNGKEKIQWFTGILTAIIVVFLLLFFVTPGIKNNQKQIIKEKTSNSPSAFIHENGGQKF